eukprot:3597506-Pyramimonas_sp.AAC.1
MRIYLRFLHLIGPSREYTCAMLVGNVCGVVQQQGVRIDPQQGVRIDPQQGVRIDPQQGV